jgi:hypothetical protein
MKQDQAVRSRKLTDILREIERLKPQRVEGQLLNPKLALLRQWQSDRLARTYADFTSQPRYQPAMRFFLEDIYAARDFSQRNHDIERMYQMLARVAPEPMIRPLVLTVELHYLTEQLDDRLLQVLVERLQMNGSLTTALYAEAYRLCDNYAERVKQIELIGEIGEKLDSAVRMPLSGPIFNLAQVTLQRGGWADLMAFAERGYKAFRQMRGAKEFLGTIRRRERCILDRIYAGEPDPFGVPCS